MKSKSLKSLTITRPLLKTTLAVGLISVATAVGLGALNPTSTTAATTPSDDKTIIHVLNRIGFGPRPGDVERVQEMGLASYIDQQLHPERIADEALNARLADFTTLTMSTRELSEKYYQPA